jgi:hypothetical protein
VNFEMFAKLFNGVNILINALVLKVRGFLARLGDALSGEPARVIGYGAALIVYFIANMSGRIPDVSFDEAVIRTTAALAIVSAVIESIRKVTYSKNAVGQIIDETYRHHTDYQEWLAGEFIALQQKYDAQVAELEALKAAKAASDAASKG